MARLGLISMESSHSQSLFGYRPPPKPRTGAQKVVGMSWGGILPESTRNCCSHRNHQVYWTAVHPVWKWGFLWAWGSVS